MTVGSFRGPYAFLSNFHPSPLVWRERQWATVEHAFQAAKIPAGFRWKYDQVHLAATPAEAKRIARSSGLRVPNWDEIKVDVMRELIALKFPCDVRSRLSAMLVETRGRELIEGNTWGDRFWGVCDGVGENKLGELLMERRTQL